MTHSHLTKGTLNDIELCKLPATLRTSNVSVSKKYLMKLSDKIIIMAYLNLAKKILNGIKLCKLNGTTKIWISS